MVRTYACIEMFESIKNGAVLASENNMIVLKEKWLHSINGIKKKTTRFRVFDSIHFVRMHTSVQLFLAETRL